jgi:SAM-dependent methyltransferase
MSRYGDYADQPFIADYYDQLPIVRDYPDVPFYLELARHHGSPVLELGCGTGRVLLPLAAAGFEVTGLDLSPHMLDRCRQKLAAQPEEVQRRVRLLQGSMTAFDLGGIFPLVIVPYRIFQLLLSLEEQFACLDSIRRHLAPAGTLALTFFQTDPRRTYDPVFHQETERCPETLLPDGRRLRLTDRIAAFHPAEQFNDGELIYYITHPDGRRERLVQHLTVRYFFRYEVEHLLARAGFRVTELFGNYDRAPLTDASPEMIFLATPDQLEAELFG